MRVSIALLPLIGAALALPVHPPQPAHAEFLGLESLPIFGGAGMGMGKVNVAESIATLNATLGGILPYVSPEVIAKVQGFFDQVQAGNQLTGDHSINANFNPSGMDMEGVEIPQWLMELLGTLMKIFGGGMDMPFPPIGGPPGMPTDMPPMPPIPTGMPTDMPPMPPLPTDMPMPPPPGTDQDPSSTATTTSTESSETGMPTDTETPPSQTDDEPLPEETGEPEEPLPEVPLPEEPIPEEPLPGSEPEVPEIPVPGESDTPEESEVPAPEETGTPLPGSETLAPPASFPATMTFPTSFPTIPPPATTSSASSSSSAAPSGESDAPKPKLPGHPDSGY